MQSKVAQHWTSEFLWIICYTEWRLNMIGMISTWVSSTCIHTCTKTSCLDGRFGAEEVSTESVAAQTKGELGF